MHESKNQFLAVLSHELKTPLVSLKGFLQLMKDGRVRESDIPGAMDICWRNMGKLEKQINSLLDLTRLKHSGDELEVEAVDLAALVREEAAKLKPPQGGPPLVLDLSGPLGGSVIIQGNEAKLRQMTAMILAQALEPNSKPEGVLVGLQAAGSGAELEISGLDPGGKLAQGARAISSTDDTQLDMNELLGRLGIGMSLVYHIVRLHQGALSQGGRTGQYVSISINL